jgi:bacterioferritin (cytochrome b1)
VNSNDSVLTSLRAALPGEATLNLQYRMNTRVLKMMGVKKTADKMSDYADDAHQFLKKLSKQLLNLGGSSDYSPRAITQPATLTAMLTQAVADEKTICDAYERNIQVAVKALDDMTRNLWEHLIKWHRGHQFWLERQLRLIAELTEKDYIEEKL